MDRFELELKDALARREPPRGFTSQVMQAVENDGAADLLESPVSRGSSARVWRWATIGALAASLSFGFVIEKRRSERQAAELASAQIYEALALAGSKINYAREAVQGPRAGVAQGTRGAER